MAAAMNIIHIKNWIQTKFALSDMNLFSMQENEDLIQYLTIRNSVSETKCLHYPF